MRNETEQSRVTLLFIAALCYITSNNDSIGGKGGWCGGHFYVLNRDKEVGRLPKNLINFRSMMKRTEDKVNSFVKVCAY